MRVFVIGGNKNSDKSIDIRSTSRAALLIHHALFSLPAG